MAIAILVHGYNVWDGGKKTIGKLAPFFKDRNISPKVVKYGWFGIGRTYTKNCKVAQRVARACEIAKLAAPNEPIIVVGHSNGCAIIHLACTRFGAKVDKAVYINPALEKDVPVPSNMNALDVWFSPSDKAVAWSRWLPFHPWGEMGRTGYMGKKSLKVRSYDKEHNYKVSSSAHSDVFKDTKLSFFGPLIVSKTLAK